MAGGLPLLGGRRPPCTMGAGISPPTAQAHIIKREEERKRKRQRVKDKEKTQRESERKDSARTYIPDEVHKKASSNCIVRAEMYMYWAI